MNKIILISIIFNFSIYSWSLSTTSSLDNLVLFQQVRSFQEDIQKHFSNHSEPDFRVFTFANDRYLPKLAQYLKTEKTPKTSTKTKAAIIVGESAILSLLHPISLHADMIISLDIHPMMQVNIRSMLKSLKSAQSPEEFYGHYLQEIQSSPSLKEYLQKDDQYGRMLKSEPLTIEQIKELFQKYGQNLKLKEQFFLSSQDCFLESQKAAQKMHFSFATIDLFDSQQIETFVNLIEQHNIDISLINLTNLPSYDDEGLLFTFVEPLFNPDLTSTVHRSISESTVMSNDLDNIKRSLFIRAAKAISTHHKQGTNMPMHTIFPKLPSRFARLNHGIAFLGAHYLNPFSILVENNSKVDLMILNKHKQPQGGKDFYLHHIYGLLHAFKNSQSSDEFIKKYYAHCIYDEHEDLEKYKDKSFKLFKTFLLNHGIITGNNSIENNPNAIKEVFLKKIFPLEFWTSQKVFLTYKDPLQALDLMFFALDPSNKQSIKHFASNMRRHKQELSFLDLTTIPLSDLNADDPIFSLLDDQTQVLFKGSDQALTLATASEIMQTMA